MLSFSLNGNILIVKETVHCASMTQVRFWNYDIVNWRVNANGREGELPTVDMCQSSIDWVKKHYFSKVGLV